MSAAQIAAWVTIAGVLIGCGASTALPPPEQGPAAPPTIIERTAPPATSTAAQAATPAPPPCAGDECWKLGTRTKDRAEAATFFRAGCEQDHAASCDFLAQMLDRPDCKSPEFGCLSEEGLVVARKGCRLGRGSSCFYVAQSTRASADPVQLEALYAKGCESDSDVFRTRSCPIAIDMALKRSDLAAVARLSREICYDDDEALTAGCAWYGWLLATGQGITKDEARGRAILTNACANGDKEACARKKQLTRWGRASR